MLFFTPQTTFIEPGLNRQIVHFNFGAKDKFSVQSLFIENEIRF